MERRARVEAASGDGARALDPVLGFGESLERLSKALTEMAGAAAETAGAFSQTLDVLADLAARVVVRTISRHLLYARLRRWLPDAWAQWLSCHLPVWLVERLVLSAREDDLGAGDSGDVGSVPCCHPECDAAAEWAIYTDYAAPDAYTHACTEHVGELLTGTDVYYVYRIGGEGDRRGG